jgi:AmmeMemoRadiSam system protein B
MAAKPQAAGSCIMPSIREPSCIGCYPADPDELRRGFAELFAHPNSSGLPRDVKPDGSLIAALVPHIDYARGGLTYTWGFKEIVERTNASLFVIIGTSHYSYERFTLTRQDFRTPLGIVETDQRYIDRLEALYGPGLFNDPRAHEPEHSIELEVVLLQYLYEGRRPIRIVPLVVGSFMDCVALNQRPAAMRDIGRMITALRKLHAARDEEICYVISGDLAHIGPKFNDPQPVAEWQLAHSRAQDLALLQRVERIDSRGYFELIQREQDVRRICGFPPTCTVLEAIMPRRGRVLHYGCYVAPDGFESVSFASATFDA